MAFQKVRKSHNGNDIYAIPVGVVEGTPKKYKTGRKGFTVFAKVTDDEGNQYQLSGNLIKL